MRSLAPARACSRSVRGLAAAADLHRSAPVQQTAGELAHLRAMWSEVLPWPLEARELNPSHRAIALPGGCSRATDPEISKRFQSACELLDALVAVGRTAPASGPTELDVKPFDDARGPTTPRAHSQTVVLRRPSHRSSANNLASGSPVPVTMPRTIWAASMENVIPFPPYPSTASVRRRPGTRPIDGVPVSLAPKLPVH